MNTSKIDISTITDSNFMEMFSNINESYFSHYSKKELQTIYWNMTNSNVKLRGDKAQFIIELNQYIKATKGALAFKNMM